MYMQHKGCCKIVPYCVISQYVLIDHLCFLRHDEYSKDKIKVLQSKSYKCNPKESAVLQERSKVYIFQPPFIISCNKAVHLNKAHIFVSEQNLLFSAVLLVKVCKRVGNKCGIIQSGTNLVLLTHCPIEHKPVY